MPPSPLPADPRSLAAGRLWTLSAGLLVAMPPAMVASSRSSTLVIALAALAALAAARLEGGLGQLAVRARAALARPLGRLALVFLAWATLTLVWSPYPGMALTQWGEFVLPLASALVLALLLPGRAPRVAAYALALSVAASCLVMHAELLMDFAVRNALGGFGASYVFNRPTLTALVLLLPAAAMLSWAVPARRAGPLGLGLILLVVATVFHSESGAAALGLLVGAGAFLLARLSAPLARRVAMAGLVLAVVGAPFAGDLASRLVPARVHQGLASSHSDDRVRIWRAFGAAVRAEPFVGQGFGASPGLYFTPVNARIPEKFQRMYLLAVGHPHNAALQVWVELGVVGAALLVALGLALLHEWRHLPRERLAPYLAIFAAAAAVSLVGHGAWQGWWPAAIGAAIVWYRLVERWERPEARSGERS